MSDPSVHRIDIDAALVTFCDAGGAGGLVGVWAKSLRCGVALHLVRYSTPIARHGPHGAGAVPG